LQSVDRGFPHSDMSFIAFFITRLVYSCSATNKMHLLSQIIYSCKTLYMFRTVFPSIIRSSKLRTQRRYMSNSCCYLLLSAMRWIGVPSIIRSSKLRTQRRYMSNSCCYLLLSGMRWNWRTARHHLRTRHSFPYVVQYAS